MPRRDAPRTTINNIVVTGYEKKRIPSKHYVFVVDVTWNNDERYEVLRRYSEFFSLQETLKSAFPESGSSKDKRFSLPTLPRRIFLGRSHVARVAEARLESLNQYCQSLVRLDSVVSESKHVIGFFSPKIGDRQQQKLRLHRPASLHPMKKPAGNLFEEHCVIATFQAEESNQLSAESGDQVLVLNKDKSGWWLIQRQKKVGWIPSSYLKKCSKLEPDKEDILGMVEDYAVEDSGAKSKTKSIDRNRSSTVTGASSGYSDSGVELEVEEYIAIETYKGVGNSQLSFQEGEVIAILDKMEDGWWFANRDGEEGWVPCGYLEPVNQEGTEEDEVPVTSLDTATEKYRSIGAYTAEEDDEISFPSGVTMEVLQKTLVGWWLVRYNGTLGVAPATFLKKVEGGEDEKEPDSVSVTSETQEESMDFSSKQQQTSPRKKTVRRKANSRLRNKTPTYSISEEDDISPAKVETRQSPSRQSKNTPPEVKYDELTKPFNKERRVSDPSGNGLKVSATKLRSSSNSHISDTDLPSLPRRPRPTQIKRAIASSPPLPETLTPKETNRSRSPSPKPKPRKMIVAQNGSTEHHIVPNETFSPPDETVAAAQQLAAATLKYIQVSRDPTLLAALREAIASDDEIQKLLKE